MVERSQDDQLREMAEHRGFRLVRSRRRKPGVGDFGKFGLTDAAGKSVLGIGDEGLTASASEIEAYLREGALSTWKQSAQSPNLATKKPARPNPVVEEPEPPVIRRRKATDLGYARSAQGAAAKRRAPTDIPPAEKDDRSRASHQDNETPAPVPAPKPEAVLAIRPAKRSDDAALADLILAMPAHNANRAEILGSLAAAQKGSSGVLVATLDEVVGCCGWTVVQTPHLGAIGRLSLILVHEDYRRRGIGRQLVEAAGAALSKKGCSRFEAMSDIDVRNSHGFFRTLAFEQSSYRFVRAIGSGR